MIIEGRFNGPAGSGNGGYTAGLVAAELAAPAGYAAQVTLRVPPPLDSRLSVTRTGDGLAVHAGEQLVAEAEPVRFDDEPVPPVPYPAAVTASGQYPGFTDHPFPTCYVCGPRRPAGDGLRIYPGPLPDGRTAAPWQAPADASTVTAWAALDCPGGWAVLVAGRRYVLGRITARVYADPLPGEPYVVTGAVVAAEGRKAQVRSALYGADPDSAPLLAQARATWIEI